MYVCVYIYIMYLFIEQLELGARVYRKMLTNLSTATTPSYFLSQTLTQTANT